MTTTRPYHHGDLRRALLEAAVEAIAESRAGRAEPARPGPPGRGLARRAGPPLRRQGRAAHRARRRGLRAAGRRPRRGLERHRAVPRGRRGLRAVRRRAPGALRGDVPARSVPRRRSGVLAAKARGRPRRCTAGSAALPSRPGGRDPMVAGSPPGRSCTASPRCGSTARCRDGLGDDPESAARAVAALLFPETMTRFPGLRRRAEARRCARASHHGDRHPADGRFTAARAVLAGSASNGGGSCSRTGVDIGGGAPTSGRGDGTAVVQVGDPDEVRHPDPLQPAALGPPDRVTTSRRTRRCLPTSASG